MFPVTSRCLGTFVLAIALCMLQHWRWCSPKLDILHRLSIALIPSVAATMFRCILLTVASVALRIVDPETLQLGRILPVSRTQAASLTWYLKWGLPFWAIAEWNSLLNRWAENKWIWTNNKSDWKWKSELAVVTGGSAGIGGCLVKKLVSHGIKVAVLDVSPLSDTFTTGVW